MKEVDQMEKDRAQDAHKKIVAEVKKRAMQFVQDNFTEYDQKTIFIVENAMFIGASIVFQEVKL